MKRYAWLLVAGLVLSLGALPLARRIRFPEPEVASAGAPDTAALSLVLAGAGLEPATAAVPKDHRVMVEVRNDRAVAVTLALQGYEDRVTAGPIPPGGTWRGSFLADRPGEAFAWMLDGAAVGRLAVTGSHLEEGHR